MWCTEGTRIIRKKTRHCEKKEKKERKTKMENIEFWEDGEIQISDPLCDENYGVASASSENFLQKEGKMESAKQKKEIIRNGCMKKRAEEPQNR